MEPIPFKSVFKLNDAGEIADIYQCEVCFALVDKEMIQGHTDWHGRIGK